MVKTLRIIFLFLMILYLCGCATYRFHHGKAPYDKGYVVSRDDYTIVEYTIGKDNTVPRKIKLAKDRFQRRRNTVEDYYKRMGLVENHFTMVTWKPFCYLVKMIGGVFCLPFIGISEYRYNHNPVYREKIKAYREARDVAEEIRIQKLKDRVRAYAVEDAEREKPSIQETPMPKDLAIQEQAEIIPLPERAIESNSQTIAQPEEIKPIEDALVPPEAETKALDTAPATTTQEPSIATPPEVKTVEAAKQEPIQKIQESQEAGKKEITAVIIARPLKGLSPLKVRFYANKSHSPYGKIISYHWDFGDQDVSTKPNPINTFWSGQFGAKIYTVTLVVQDNKGNVGQTSIDIEVQNK